METLWTITVQNARAVVLARYYYVLGQYHGANHLGERELIESCQGQLKGLAFALGALGHREDLPQ